MNMYFYPVINKHFYGVCLQQNLIHQKQMYQSRVMETGQIQTSFRLVMDKKLVEFLVGLSALSVCCRMSLVLNVSR